ncbi:hypothetical protein LINGRAHAP2_LOCUS8076, partial [Linum grandiflorum]
LTIESTFTEDGSFIPILFDTFDVKLIVVKSARQMRALGCTIKWEFTYDGANGNASISNLKNVMMQVFRDLDVYLRNHRDIRAPSIDLRQFLSSIPFCIIPLRILPLLNKKDGHYN